MSISLSLVIPVYNRAALVSATIKSALAQDQPFDEIIVVDDGSVDSTFEVLSEFGSAITVLRQENQGVQAARNLGVEAASSNWVVLCDSDDLLMSDYASTFRAIVSQGREFDLVYSNFLLFGEVSAEIDKLSLCPFDFIQDAVVESNVASNIPDLFLRL